MTRRSIFFSLAAGLIALSLGTADSRAGGMVPLPTTLDQLLTATGNSTQVDGLVFSNFQITPTTIPGGGSSAAAVNLDAFSNFGYNGLTIQSSIFNAAAGSTTDYRISYDVMAVKGVITGGYLLVAGGTGNGGYINVGETITDKNGNAIATLEGYLPGSPVDKMSWSGVQTIHVEKDIFVQGGTNVATLSIINQGFMTVPEPTSMALLGIGLSGLLTFRRFRRRAVVA